MIEENWIRVIDQPPTPTCGINDLLLWCPCNSMGQQLVLGQYDGESFTAFFETDDDMSHVVRKRLYVTHWQTAPHMGPDFKPTIVIRKEYAPQPNEVKE